MGRHHHLRFPEHLYLSPPPPPSSSFSLGSSPILAVKSAIYLSSTTSSLPETGRSKTFAVGDLIPGFKTSAAFFTTLRANLILDLEPTSLLADTPDVLRPVDFYSTSTFPVTSPSQLAHHPRMADEHTALASKPEDTLSSLPDLTTKPAITEDDKIEALHLIADSVAQQRQLASTALIFHPVTLGVFVLLVGLTYQHFYKGAYSDYAIIGTTSAGILMAVLITVRWLTGGYIFEAERIGTWKWLNEGRDGAESGIVGAQDEILLTKFGDEIIGTTVVRGIRDTTSSSGKARKNAPITGYIRAWTVLRRYRRKGIGQGLLEEAIALCESKGWQGPEVADEHANSAKIIHPTFSGGFKKRERQAREMLQRVIEEQASVRGGKRAKR